MLDQITHYYLEFSRYTKDNPVLAGIVSLWGITVLTLLLRDIPLRVLRFFWGQSTTQFTTNNSWLSRQEFIAIKNFIAKQDFSWCIRSWTGRLRYEQGNTLLSPGYGLNFFIYRRRFFWYYRYIDTHALSFDAQLEKIEICTFGRSALIFEEILKDAYFNDNGNKLSIYHYKGLSDGWCKMGTMVPRGIKSVFYKGQVKEDILNGINSFLVEEDWYRYRCIPYKRTYMLHGPTGTGKTSLIKAMAAYFHKDLYVIPLSKVKGEELIPMFGEAGKNAFVLMEDIDDTKGILKRDLLEGDPDIEPAKEGESSNTLATTKVTLSDLLNALDGVAELDGTVIFITTNCIEKLDPALLRKGRVDYTHYIGYLSDEEIKAYLDYMLGDTENVPSYTGLTFDDIAGCDLAGLYLEHHLEPSKLISSIPLK